MPRILLLLIAFCGIVCVRPAQAQNEAQALVPQSVARRHGMVRDWYTLLQIDRRHEVGALSYEGGTLFVQSSGGLLHAIDAASGRTLWTAEVGVTGKDTLPPAANHSFVACLSNSDLYLFRRSDGSFLWKRTLPARPETTPVVTELLVMVPTSNGSAYSFPLDDPAGDMLSYGLGSKTSIPPLVSPESVVISTPNGRMHSLLSGTAQVRYTWQSDGGITVPPTRIAPRVYAASLDGYVYAVDEIAGGTYWQFSAGEPIRHTPVAIANTVYAFPESGGVFAVDAESGAERWWAPRPRSFVAASPSRLYMLDPTRQMLVLNAQTGATVDVFPLDEAVHVWPNTSTDRIFLYTRGGLIQCLREAELKEPVVYVAPSAAPAAAAPAGPTTQRGIDDPAAAPARPAAPAQPAAPAGDADDPFGDVPADDSMPAEGGDGIFGSEEPADDANDPFGEAPADDAGMDDEGMEEDAGGEDPFGSDPEEDADMEDDGAMEEEGAIEEDADADDAEDLFGS